MAARLVALLMSITAFAGCAAVARQPVVQEPITRVELMPNIPQPFKPKDWKRVARDYDAIAFDFNRTGEHLPLIRWDDAGGKRMFALPSYVGHPPTTQGSRHEAINTLGVLLGSTVAGFDKAGGEHNFVAMASGYYNERLRLVLNNRKDKSGNSFWYELYPHVLYYSLADRYRVMPQVSGMDDIVRATADRWYDACVALGCRDGKADFNFTSFDFDTMQPKYNDKWREPDSAAAIAWLMYAAYCRFGDAKYLEATDWCLTYLQNLQVNPNYEVLMCLGAYTAARMNAEHGRNYPVGRFISNVFDPNSVRKGWGVIADRWGEVDAHGLVGSTTDKKGYGFAMNTFATAGSLVPLVRYDARYARAMAKWMLNASNAARLFYADEHDADHQSCPQWAGDPAKCIAYEGCRKVWKGKSPYAIGDCTQYGWGPIDFGLYGSGYVGLYAGMIHPTDVPTIPQLDLLATDFYRRSAYPSYLLWNPHEVARDVTVTHDMGPVDLYDAVQRRFVARGQKSRSRITLQPDQAAVIVITPPAGKVTEKDGQVLVNGVVVDYGFPAAR